MDQHQQQRATGNAAPTLAALTRWAGRELGLSPWLKVDQHLVDCFAACTGDDQWIHIDVERARSGPFGGTIAHGWLVASLLAPWTLDALAQTVGPSRALNYGVDKLRFVNPVRCNTWVRGRMRLASVEPKGADQALLAIDSTVEINGQDKPALVATTLTLLAVSGNP
ncbi:MAG: MaoC family dehydratase [Ramlibacter sp.]